MQPPPFPIGRNSCPNATILTLPSSCFLPGTTRRCYHPNASIQMSASHHCHPVATTPPLPSQCYWSNVTISMISSWQYLPNAHSPMTSQCYHPDANVLMQSSWHYHPDATISKNKSTTVSSYQLDTSILILPSQCHNAESKEMVHNTILNALTFWVELKKINKHVARRKIQNDGKKNGPNNLNAQALLLGCYHPDATILTWLKYCYVLLLVLSIVWMYPCIFFLIKDV